MTHSPDILLTCPACRTRPKGSGYYLCHYCWGQLRLRARRALRRRDVTGAQRLRELYGQIHRGVPLDQIEITP